MREDGTTMAVDSVAGCGLLHQDIDSTFSVSGLDTQRILLALSLDVREYEDALTLLHRLIVTRRILLGPWEPSPIHQLIVELHDARLELEDARNFFGI